MFERLGGPDARTVAETYFKDPNEERFQEFMAVCRSLWTSWDADAVVMDRARGLFADPAKVRRVEHRGRFFASRGPLTVVRSPQCGPVIVQAGVPPAYEVRGVAS